MPGRNGGRPPKLYLAFGFGPFTLRDMEEISGIPSYTIKNRLQDGWPMEEALIYQVRELPPRLLAARRARKASKGRLTSQKPTE